MKLTFATARTARFHAPGHRLRAAVLPVLATLGCSEGYPAALVSVEVLVEQGLEATGAWRVQTIDEPWSPLQPFVQATRWEDGRLFVKINRLLDDDHAERVELWLAVDEVPLRAESQAYWDENSNRGSAGGVYAVARGLHGTVKLDQAGFPQENAPRIVAYHLEGTRDGVAVVFEGKLAVTAGDLLE